MQHLLAKFFPLGGYNQCLDRAIYAEIKNSYEDSLQPLIPSRVPDKLDRCKIGMPNMQDGIASYMNI